MNYIIIYSTAILIKNNKKPIRILFASIIGAVYAVISVMKIVDLCDFILIKILFSAVIVYVALNTQNFKELLKGLLIFYLVSFAFGGIALALLYIIKPENILMKNGVYVGTYPIKVILLGGILGYILISIVYSIIKSKYKQRKKVCEIEIVINKKSKKLNALIDSGNFLREPITGTPVIVVEISYLFGIIPDKILNNINDILMGKYNILEDEKSQYDKNELEKDEYIFFKNFVNKFRVIPFNSLGKENGLLLGIKADYIKIISNDDVEKKKIEDVIIALYDKKISKERYI